MRAKIKKLQKPIFACSLSDNSYKDFERASVTSNKTAHTQKKLIL